MIRSLRGSAARATVSSAGYVCLACQGIPQPQLRTTTTAAQRAASSSALSPAQAETLNLSATTSTIHGAFRAAIRSAKLNTPEIHTDGGRQDGYKAHLELDGKTFTTPLYMDVRSATKKVKILVIEYIKNQRQADPTEVSRDVVAEEETEKKKEASQELVQGPQQQKPSLRGTQVKRRMKKIGDRRVRIIRILSRVQPRKVMVHTAPYPFSSNGPPTSKFNPQEVSLARGAKHSATFPRRRPSASAPTAKTLTRSKPRRTREGLTTKYPRTKNLKIKDLRAVEGSQTVIPLALQQENLAVPTEKVPRLSFGLDRVLFNPGVHHVQDPRSRVYNFDPYLEKITHPRNFNFAALDDFRPPSADDTLSTIAKENNAKYFSSTSSITPVLVQLHFLLSNWRPLNFEDLSTKFFVGSPHEPDKGDFTRYQKSPQSIFLKPKHGGYAIDVAVDKPFSGLLSFLGQCLEKLFTVPKEVFETYLKESVGEKPVPTSNGYHYTKFDSILIRSQLDAHDERLPGTGIFDIKTRAVLPIRMDTLEAQQDVSKNYELKTLHGPFESFEREFFDMARATMMKYSLQARLGRMDGIFVAYHNIVRLFGFQYLSISDMDKVLHGQVDTALGDAELNASLRVLSSILDHAVKIYPDEPVRLYFESSKARRALNVYVLPATEDQIDEQREEARRMSREYLEQLNNTEDNTNEPGSSQADIDLLEELFKEAVDPKPAKEVQHELKEAILQNSTPEPGNPAQESDPNAASEDGADTESIRDEVSRLFTKAAKISMDTNVLLRKESNALSSPQLRKMILKDITKKTFGFSQDVKKLETLLGCSDAKINENYQLDLQRLLGLVKDQDEMNQSLFDQAEAENVMTGTEIKDLTNVQTLEAALKASKERYSTPPPRISAFSVKAQSHINDDLVRGPPEDIAKDSKWELTYLIEDYKPEDVRDMYLRMIRIKDGAAMSNWESNKVGQFYEGNFFKHLMKLSKEGGKWREERDHLDRSREVIVYEPRSE